VAQIITFGRLHRAAFCGDVAACWRALRAGRQAVAKLVPQTRAAAGDAIPRAIATSRVCRPKRDNQPIVARAFMIAQKLRGPLPPRLAHAAGS